MIRFHSRRLRLRQLQNYLTKRSPPCTVLQPDYPTCATASTASTVIPYSEYRRWYGAEAPK